MAEKLKPELPNIEDVRSVKSTTSSKRQMKDVQKKEPPSQKKQTEDDHSAGASASGKSEGVQLREGYPSNRKRNKNVNPKESLSSSKDKVKKTQQRESLTSKTMVKSVLPVKSSLTEFAECSPPTESSTSLKGPDKEPQSKESHAPLKGPTENVQPKESPSALRGDECGLSIKSSSPKKEMKSRESPVSPKKKCDGNKSVESPAFSKVNVSTKLKESRSYPKLEDPTSTETAAGEPVELEDPPASETTAAEFMKPTSYPVSITVFPVSQKGQATSLILHEPLISKKQSTKQLDESPNSKNKLVASVKPKEFPVSQKEQDKHVKQVEFPVFPNEHAEFMQPRTSGSQKDPPEFDCPLKFPGSKMKIVESLKPKKSSISEKTRLKSVHERKSPVSENTKVDFHLNKFQPLNEEMQDKKLAETSSNEKEVHDSKQTESSASAKSSSLMQDSGSHGIIVPSVDSLKDRKFEDQTEEPFIRLEGDNSAQMKDCNTASENVCNTQSEDSSNIIALDDILSRAPLEGILALKRQLVVVGFGIVGKPRLTLPTYKLRSNHSLAARAFREMPNPVENADLDALDLARSIDVCLKAQVSKTPLSRLQRMSLEDLHLWQYEKGKYLLLRLLEPAYGNETIITVVEDHVGNAVVFHLHNFRHFKDMDLDDALPVGTVFALKEPYCDETFEGHCILHCKCPSDMIFLFEGEEHFRLVKEIAWKSGVIYNDITVPPKPENSNDWETRGRSLCVKGKLQCASYCYRMALKHRKKDRPEDLQSLYLSLAGIYNNSGDFEACMDTLQTGVLNQPSGNASLGLLIAAEACYNLRRYEESKKFMDTVIKIHPSDNKLKKRAEFHEQRLKERTEGKFDMGRLLEFRSVNSMMPIDCADYKGPVKFENKMDKGRCVVANKDVEPGTLLIVSKAHAFAWKFKEAVNGRQLWHFLIARLGKLILKNPHAHGWNIYRLNDGSGEPIQDFPDVYCDPESKKEPIVDVRKLAGILLKNMLGDSCDIYGLQNALKKRNYLKKSGCGLFLWPAYINHSCLPNVSINEYNDVIVIHAIKSIKKGEEIFLPYVSWELPYSMRKTYYLRRGFHCDCKLCKQDEGVSEEIHDRRQELSRRYEMVYECLMDKRKIDNLPQFLKYILDMAKEYNATYKSPGECYPLQMASMWALLAKAHSLEVTGHRWDPQLQITYHQLTLECMGFHPNDLLKSLEKGEDLIAPNAFLDANVLHAVSEMVYNYSMLGRLQLKNKWSHILFILDHIHSGCGIEAVRLKYRNCCGLI